MESEFAIRRQKQIQEILYRLDNRIGILRRVEGCVSKKERVPGLFNGNTQDITKVDNVQIKETTDELKSALLAAVEADIRKILGLPLTSSLQREPISVGRGRPPKNRENRDRLVEAATNQPLVRELIERLNSDPRVIDIKNPRNYILWTLSGEAYVFFQRPQTKKTEIR